MLTVACWACGCVVEEGERRKEAQCTCYGCAKTTSSQRLLECLNRHPRMRKVRDTFWSRAAELLNFGIPQDRKVPAIPNPCETYTDLVNLHMQLCLILRHVRIRRQ